MAVEQSLHVDALHKALLAEAEAYKKLIALVEREKPALQRENLAGLAELIRDKEALMEEIVQRERAREQLVARLAKALALPETISLSDLITHFDELTAQKLSALRQGFIDLVEQLLILNHGNRLLMQSGLDRVEATFDYLAAVVAPPDGNYTARGANRPQKQLTAGQMLNWQA